MDDIPWSKIAFIAAFAIIGISSIFISNAIFPNNVGACVGSTIGTTVIGAGLVAIIVYIKNDSIATTTTTSSI
jgi:hypothetical protein